MNIATPPWLPLKELCPRCQTGDSTGRHIHEPQYVLKSLFSHLNLTSSRGVFVDGGTSYDMADGLVALGLGFTVIGIDARLHVIDTLRQRHAANITTGVLTLRHSGLSDQAGGRATVYNALDSTSLSKAAASRDPRGLEREKHSSHDAPLATLDAIVPEDMPCAAIKLDIQGHEAAALRGASALLSRRAGLAPLVIFELTESA